MPKELFNSKYAGPNIGFVLVIARAPKERKVAVVCKNRPSWQAGRYNFPGGKIEANETPLDAALREVREETGVVLLAEQLQPVAHIFRKNDFEMFVFSAEAQQILDAVALTDEAVFLLDEEKVRHISPEDGIENLPWLYGMAFDGQRKCAQVEYD